MKSFVKRLLRKPVYWLREERMLTPRAREERRRDRRGPFPEDPGSEAVIQAGLDWLCRAQDCSASADGGVARDFGLITGWATSYPETTGYIVPTFLELSASRPGLDLEQRARRMLDWLTSIQFPDGPFAGGKVNAPVRVPVTFNTGQILLGLAAGVKHLGICEEQTVRAADWLAHTQDSDGCWRAYPTPFAAPGEKAYETHVAWGLFEAHAVTGDARYLDAAVANVRWALTQQEDNGWFRNCCLSYADRPLTHTIGYAVRGIVEAYRATGDPDFARAARRTADAIVTVAEPDGRLAGTWRRDWTPGCDWVCLTGSVQLAHSLLLLHRDEANANYLETARRLNRFVRRTIRMSGDPDIAGAVKGSFPVDGAYGRYEFLNWAVKFCVDSNVCELETVAPVT